MASIQTTETFPENPLDLIEQVALGRQWNFERGSEEEIVISLPGQWAEYQIALNWREDMEALHLICMFDFKAPGPRREETGRLILQLNEELWLGHFDMWRDNGALMYRYGLLLAGAAEVTSEQCETTLQLALETCERFYPAFQYVIWAGESADNAMKASMFETAGEA